MGLENLQHNFLTGTLEGMVKWARASSSWGANFGLACCAMEMMAAGAANFDLARFGMEVFRASPRQADVMIVARALTSIGPAPGSLAFTVAPRTRPPSVIGSSASVPSHTVAPALPARSATSASRSLRVMTYP